MSAPKPKILTRVTVPTGGYDLKFYLSAAGAYDTAVTSTIPAGNYYIAGDNGDDDLLFALQTQMTTGAIAALGAAHYVHAYIDDTTKKIVIQFDGFAGIENDVKLAWTESDAVLVSWLGFDNAADDTSTTSDDPAFTADYRHSHGWYASEFGQLAEFKFGIPVASSLQSIARDGSIYTQKVGLRRRSELRLQHLDRPEVISYGLTYGQVVNINGTRFEINRALEAWYLEAIKGTPFRVYGQARQDLGSEVIYGGLTGSSSTTVEDSGRAWTVNEWINHSLVIDDFGSSTLSPSIPQVFEIASNTATVLTVSNEHASGLGLNELSHDTYRIVESIYFVYILDVQKMMEFAPAEIPAIDRFDITIPLLEFVA